MLVRSDTLRHFLFEKVFNVYVEFLQPGAVFLFGIKILGNYF